MSINAFAFSSMIENLLIFDILVVCHTIIELKLNCLQVLDAHIKHTIMFAFNILDVEFEYLTNIELEAMNLKEKMNEYLKVSFSNFIKILKKAKILILNIF